MKVLLSSIGSRGDAQPILALALELKALGHEASLCVAPNFKDWVKSFGVACIPIGPDLKKLTGGSLPTKADKPSQAQLPSLAVQSVREQFRVLDEATRKCDLIVAATALQIAARSIAEAREDSLRLCGLQPGSIPVAAPSPAELRFPPLAITAWDGQSLSVDAR